MTSDREYAKQCVAMWDYNVSAAPFGRELARRLLAALEREEKLREEIEELRRDYKDIWDESGELLRDPPHAPHGNFSDTQDTNPEGGC